MFNYIKFIISKINIILRYKKNNFLNILHYIFYEKEISNFTYEIKNEKEIIDIIKVITNENENKIKEILNEVSFDNLIFKNFFTKQFYEYYDKYKFGYKIFGRRLLWYGLIRILKPSDVIESGIDKGLGSALISYAQHINSEEQHNKYNYIGIDLKIKSNIFFNELNNYYKNYNIYYQDSHEFIKKIQSQHFSKIIYISDAKHDYNFELNEFCMIKNLLKNNSVIISDTNSGALRDFSIKNEKYLITFHEKTINHWYSGANCTVSYFY
jgi:hypothetical protein